MASFTAGRSIPSPPEPRAPTGAPQQGARRERSGAKVRAPEPSPAPIMTERRRRQSGGGNRRYSDRRHGEPEPRRGGDKRAAARAEREGRGRKSPKQIAMSRAPRAAKSRARAQKRAPAGASAREPQIIASRQKPQKPILAPFGFRRGFSRRHSRKRAHARKRRASARAATTRGRSTAQRRGRASAGGAAADPTHDPTGRQLPISAAAPADAPDWARAGMQWRRQANANAHGQPPQPVAPWPRSPVTPRAYRGGTNRHDERNSGQMIA